MTLSASTSPTAPLRFPPHGGRCRADRQSHKAKDSVGHAPAYALQEDALAWTRDDGLTDDAGVSCRRLDGAPSASDA